MCGLKLDMQHSWGFFFSILFFSKYASTGGKRVWWWLESLYGHFLERLLPMNDLLLLLVVVSQPSWVAWVAWVVVVEAHLDQKTNFNAKDPSIKFTIIIKKFNHVWWMVWRKKIIRDKMANKDLFYEKRLVYLVEMLNTFRLFIIRRNRASRWSF